MNETITVLIGTLSGFIIAFFAEPVKSYFQNRAKLHNLRIALHKEILNNYFVIRGFLIHEATESELDAGVQEFIIQHSLRTECYKHALQNDVSMFYQLDEANVINLLQGKIIAEIMELSGDLKHLFGETISKHGVSLLYIDFGNQFLSFFTSLSYRGGLNTKILKELASTKEYQEIMKKGKEEADTKKVEQ